jgi:twitching motility protein PilT
MEQNNPTQTTVKEPSPNKESATDILHFEKWLSVLGEKKATDIHLLVGNVPSLRIDGIIAPLMEEEVLTSERLERIVEQLLSETELETFKKNHQLVISKTLKKSMRFRIHLFYSRGYIGISLRHLPNEAIQIAQLPNAALLTQVSLSTHGLYLVAGPFDSGKTSTVRSIITEINQKQSKYIVTLESPIEYLIPSDKSVVVQREIGKDTKSYEQGLASLHDEDVNVVVVGDINEADVLERVLELASAGRLVIATTTGNHLVAVLEHIRDLVEVGGRERIMHLLGDVLIGVSTQLLLPKVGGGRTLITSNMVATHPIKSLIREGKFGQIPNVMQTSGGDGMITMDKALSEGIKQGVITLQDAKEHATDINQFNVLVAH